jgi:hypothetical protein
MKKTYSNPVLECIALQQEEIVSVSYNDGQLDWNEDEG